MNYYFYTLRVILSRRDVRIIIFGTITGGILQILAKKYLEKHPEFLKDSPEAIDINTIPRGGQLTGQAARALALAILRHLRDQGVFTAFLLSTGGVAISKIPVNAISTCLRESMPQNLSHLDKEKFILVNGEKIYLNHCTPVTYLFKVLNTDTIPFEEKKEVAHSVLKELLDLKTPSGRLNMVLCIIFMMIIFYENQISSFHAMMKALIQAIREGRISKPMARFIIRRLGKNKIPINPELIEIVSS